MSGICSAHQGYEAACKLCNAGAKHSPAPWSVVKMSMTAAIVDANGERVMGGRSMERVFANMDLAAVAPELLASVEDLCELLRSDFKDFSKAPGFVRGKVELAEERARKARGET